MVSRLTKCIGAPGGQSFAQSIVSAENAVSQLAEEAGVHLTTTLEALQDAAAAALRSSDDAVVASLQELATEVHSIGGAFGHADLSEAAKLLNDFVAETRGGPRWSPKAIVIFADAMASLHRGGEGPPRQLVSALKVLASRVQAGSVRL